MNIVILNDYAYCNGGASKVALDSAKGWADRDCRVIMFCAVGPIQADLEGAGVEVICLNQQDILSEPNRTKAAMVGLWNKTAAKKMSELLERLDPAETIIHIHGWTRALSSAPIKIATKNGFKVVITIHDYFLACCNGAFFDFKNQHFCRLKALSLACLLRNCDARSYSHKIYRCIRLSVQKMFAGLPGGICQFIVISDFSKGIIRPYLPKSTTIYPLRNPVDIRPNKPDGKINKNGPVLFIGRIAPEKGVEVFCRAVKQLSAEAVVIGDGPLKDKLQKEYPGILFKGWLSKEKVYSDLSKAAFLVFPSLWYEGAPLVVDEARSLGVATIASDATAASDVIEDGKTGLLFSGGDVEELTAKMRLLIDRPALAHSLGVAAHRQYWQNPQTLETHINQLEHIYTSILEGKRRCSL